MSSSLKSPEPFSFAGSDLAAQWGVWRRQFKWYILATRKDEDDEEVLVGVLLTLLGVEGLKIYETFIFANPDHAKQIDKVLDKFDLHFEPGVVKCLKGLSFCVVINNLVNHLKRGSLSFAASLKTAIMVLRLIRWSVIR